MDPRSLRRTVAALSLAVAAALVPTHAGAQCVQANAEETAAIKMRALQSRLMVAALSCGVRKEYNAFVGRFDDVLAESGQTLRGYFRRSHGKAGLRELDAYVTGLANRNSMDSLDDRRQFCSTAIKALTHVMTLDGDELVAYSSTYPAEAAKSDSVCF